MSITFCNVNRMGAQLSVHVFSLVVCSVSPFIKAVHLYAHIIIYNNYIFDACLGVQKYTVWCFVSVCVYKLYIY